jgi:ethanolamine utilization protein EutQ (cupin superfamily)
MLKNFVKISRITLSFILLSLSISFVQAQDNCPTIVQDALSVMDTACSAVERNQACYGNGQIEVLAQPDFTLSAFETPGDQIEVAGIQTMTLYPLDETTSTWGVSLMQVQANLPDTVPGQNVTVLLFGDTEITSASQTLDAFYFRGGVGEAGCAQAPNGIMIQTPEGAGMIDLTINDVQVSLGSTAYVTAEVEDFLTFNLLEGEAEVTADGETQVVAGGEFVQVPMDENLSATGAPSEAEAIDFTLLPVLPIQLFTAGHQRRCA